MEATYDLDTAIGQLLKEPSKENANIRRSPSGKMLQVGSTASKWYYLNHMPERFARAHIEGDIHIHDLDYYDKCLNCLVVPLEDLLLNGFSTGNGWIRPPKRFSSAAALTAIIIQSTQNDQFGGVAVNNFGSELAPFVKVERERIKEELAGFGISGKQLEVLTESRLRDSVFQAMEAFVHNANSMHSRAGNQVPFSNVNIGMDTDPDAQLVDEMLLRAYEAGLGKHEVPLFPQIIFKIKKGVNREPGTPGYHLFQLAMKVASKNINPTFLNADAPFNIAYGKECQSMGCRTRVLANINGPQISRGRGNLFFTTINLPRLGILAQHDVERFFELLDAALLLVRDQLLERFNVIKQLRVKDIPFIMGQHLYLGSENLGPEDSIEEAAKHGTLTIGFIGLAECLKALIGKHHAESDEAQELGLKIVRRMYEFTQVATKEFSLNFSLMGTPAEGLSFRFTDLDRKRFGVIAGVTDKEYYTNSFHVPVDYEISMFRKIDIEAPYHALTPAGHITYVELQEAPYPNLEAYEKIINYMCNAGCGYFGINYPVDFCADCGTRGLLNDPACPSCGSGHIRRVRKVTGYLGFLDDFNKGKAAEVRDRKAHTREGLKV